MIYLHTLTTTVFKNHRETIFDVFIPKKENTSPDWLREAKLRFCYIFKWVKVPRTKKSPRCATDPPLTLGEELVVITMLLLAMIGRSGVELFTRSLLIGRAGRLALSKVVAPLVLLSHAVHQEEDEEDGKQEADHSAGYNRCIKKNYTLSKKSIVYNNNI